MIPINTPLIVPSISTPKNAPAKIRYSVRLTFHSRTARSNSVAPSNAEITIAVSTGIGSHVDDIEDKGDDQFEISDGRSVDEVFNALKDHGLQPVMNDYIYL